MEIFLKTNKRVGANNSSYRMESFLKINNFNILSFPCNNLTWSTEGNFFLIHPWMEKMLSVHLLTASPVSRRQHQQFLQIPVGC